MSSPAWDLFQPDRLDPSHIEGLADVLIDCVQGGASIGFMDGVERHRVVAFWQRVGADVAAGKRAILLASDAKGICGTVQLVLDMPDNQPHRADLCKMLVHRRARRKGLGAALMRAAEALARDRGRTLLVLDSITDGDASRLYRSLGWKEVGQIPNYSLSPDGRHQWGTTYFYRDLRAAGDDSQK